MLIGTAGVLVHLVVVTRSVIHSISLGHRDLSILRATPTAWNSIVQQRPVGQQEFPTERSWSFVQVGHDGDVILLRLLRVGHPGSHLFGRPIVGSAICAPQLHCRGTRLVGRVAVWS